MVRENGQAFQFRPMSKVNASIYAANWANSNGEQAKMWNSADG